MSTKNLLYNKFTRTFVLTNIVFLAVALWIRGIGEQHDFHFYYEPILVQILFVFNLPALTFAGVLLIPLVFYGIGVNPNATNVWYQYFLAFICSSIQWGLIGYWIDRVLSKKFKENKILLK